MLKTSQVIEGTGKHQVTVIGTITDDGLVVQVLGGEKPHVGAVVMSIPRPSLADNNKLSCNSYVLPRINHKEDELAKPLAEKLAKHYNAAVVLVAGLHISDANLGDIKKLIDNSNLAVEKLMRVFSAPR